MRDSALRVLRETIAGLNLDNFLVRQKRRMVVKHQDDAAWTRLDNAAREELVDDIAPLTAYDLAELERLLLEAGVAGPQDIERAKETSRGFGRFVRSLVGLERAAVNDAFASFLAHGAATREQIEFIGLVVEHPTGRGSMDPAQLYEAPFTYIAPTGAGAGSRRQRGGGSRPAHPGAKRGRDGRVRRDCEIRERRGGLGDQPLFAGAAIASNQRSTASTCGLSMPSR